MDIDKKYELIPSYREGLYRIKALKDFNDVKKGDIGGYVECEKNLQHDGNCWIYDNAVVRDNARVYGSAQVRGEAQVCKNVEVYDNAVVRDNAILRNNVRVWGNAVIQGDTQVWTNAIVIENVVFMGEVDICGDAIISSNKDFIIFKNNWSSGRYFIWTRSNNMWKVGCFYGTGEELIAKAYADGEESGREYERIVKYVESILNTEECKTNKQNIMKKKMQKPFDIEAAKNGARVETRDGMPVRIICYDKVDGIYPIIALVNNDGYETCNGYTPDGKLFCNGPGEHDLVIIEEVEEAKFNVGDWLFGTHDGTRPWLITAVTSDCYEIQDLNGCRINAYHTTVEANYRLWTLKDAKPGDILVCEGDGRPFIFKALEGVYPIAYCGIVKNSLVINVGDYGWTANTVRPATSNEKDMLFKKMEEEGYKWDVDTLTLSKIQKRWRDNEDAEVSGYYIDTVYGEIKEVALPVPVHFKKHPNIFATEKQAKSALAMARISQIMANDERFGGTISYEEWNGNSWYMIVRINNNLLVDCRIRYNFLAFHTKEQAKLFLKENEDLVKDYYMMD